MTPARRVCRYAAAVVWLAAGPAARAGDSPEAVVQRQVEAYNARDMEAFLATYADDAELITLPDKPMARGKEEMRARYTETFKNPELHAEILKRIVVGDTVVDHERVRLRFPEGVGTLDAIAISAVENGKITRVWFRRGEQKIDKQ